MKHRFVWITSRHTQVLSLALTAAVLFLLLLPPLMRFISTDVAPQLTPLVPQKESAVGGTIATVKTGLYIQDFSIFDVVGNRFIIDAIVWFQFDPTAIALDTIEKFSFEKGTILQKSAAKTKMISDELFARYKVRVSFSSSLDYRFFPINDHRLFLVLMNEFVTPNEMRFTVSESGFFTAGEIYARGWQPVDHAVRAGYTVAKLDRYDPQKSVRHPRVVFSMDFAKAGLRKVMLILIPILLLFFLGLASLLFDHDMGARSILPLCVGSLSGLLAYRFVIEKLSPEVGYFTLIDQVYTIILGLIFLLFLFNIYIMRYPYTAQVKAFKAAVFFCVELLIIGVWYYLLYHWGV